MGREEEGLRRREDKESIFLRWKEERKLELRKRQEKNEDLRMREEGGRISYDGERR